MSKINILVHINAFQDNNASNNPTKNFFKWTREMNGNSADKPKSEELTLSPGESKTLFDGSRTLSHDGTTVYSLNLKPGAESTYVLKYVSGTNPVFRTARTTGADNTTQITVIKNGTTLTFSSTGGTPLNLIAGGAVVGDQVLISGPFNAANQTKTQILSLTSTSFTIENINGVAEGPVTLSAVSDIQIFSSAGVQIADILRIFGGFSTVSRGSYEITSVIASEIEFFSAKTLPNESNVMTNQLNAYFSAKNFLYLESTRNTQVIVNGVSNGTIEPFVEGNQSSPALFMKKSTMWSVTIVNDSIDTATIFYAAIE